MSGWCRVALLRRRRGDAHPWFLFGFLLALACPSGQLRIVASDAPIVIGAASATNGQVTFTWQGGRPPYRVQASPDGLTGWEDISAFLFGNWYVGLASGELGYLRVRTASDTEAPSAPTDLIVLASRCNAVTLSWQGASDGNAGSGIHAYRVYRDGERVGEVTEPVTRFPAPFAAPNRFFLDQTLAADTNYSFTVTAVDRLDNESAPSAPILVPTPPCAEESGPPDQLTLTWDRNDGRDVAGYILYWGLRPGDYAWAMDTMDATSAEVSDLIPGVTYFFTATAYDREEMQSAPSAEIAYITRIVATPSLQPAAIPSR